MAVLSQAPYPSCSRISGNSNAVPPDSNSSVASERTSYCFLESLRVDASTGNQNLPSPARTLCDLGVTRA